jgi:hypothetical protein
MDDFVTANLHESRNEWCARLVSIFSPLVIEGFKSIFDESWKLCVENDEVNKYLMTFQELLTRVPKWNNEIISTERKRIIERSGCNYLEDLITCVHIIQLKVLTCVRVGNKQKKIDISIPKLDDFIHKVYIHCARKIYSNVYLFEKNINPLQIQKNRRELELIVQECLMISIRDSIPTEDIIRAYMDENVEEEEQVIIEDIPKTQEQGDVQPSLIQDKHEEVTMETSEPQETKEKSEEPPVELGIRDLDDEKVVTTLTFNDMDSVLDTDNNVSNIEAPKSIERLEELSTTRALERKMEEAENNDYDDIDDEALNISDEVIHLNDFEDVSSVVKIN